MTVSEPTALLPERIIQNMLQLGVAAITANPTILDDVLGTLGTTERTKAKSIFAAHPPTVVMGYPRNGIVLPCFAVTLSGDDPGQDYVGQAEAALFDDDDVQVGNRFAQRTQASFTVWIYAEHPDMCAWYYRVLRRICNAGTRYLVNRGLEEPQIRGAELAPDPRYQPENVFTRRLTISVNYLEQWTDQDALWQALNGDPDAFTKDINSVLVAHEDTRVIEGVAGGVHPVTDPDALDDWEEP